MRKTRVLVAAFLMQCVAASASLHLMQIEQVIGGVSGDTSAQAVQLRMRALGQNLLEPARIRVWDSQGQNPITIIDFPESVPNALPGSRILIASETFAAHTSPLGSPDFVMTQTIPASYLAAGSLTYERTSPNIIYWRLSWGGAAYAGDTTGDSTNDDDPGVEPADFGPPYAGGLPFECARALYFDGPHSALSTSNAEDYVLTLGAAIFENNAGVEYEVTIGQPCTTAVDCDDANVCTDDACLSGCCQNTFNVLPCDDGLFCTLVDACAQGQCVGSGDACPKQTCDEINDVCLGCVNDAGCDDGIACTVNQCVGGECIFTPDDAACDNPAFCDGAETCDVILGCVPGSGPCVPPLFCDEAANLCVECLKDGHCGDGVGCTVDACVNGSCTFVTQNAACDDGLFCNGVETCDGVLDCRSGTPPCVPPLQCDETLDACVECLGDQECEDGNLCTDDHCINGFCTYPNNSAPCDDGLFCTLTDACLDGECQGSGSPCPPPLLCDEANDRCVCCFQNSDCDDGVSCTVDSCQGDCCVHSPQHSACDDGLFCNGAESCHSTDGCQAGSPPCEPPLFCSEGLNACVACLLDVHCIDDNVCTNDQCSASGTCTHSNNTAPCDDGVACTTDRCSMGVCLGTADHSACSNGVFCDGTERCQPPIGCVSGMPPCSAASCDESNLSCAPALGVTGLLVLSVGFGLVGCFAIRRRIPA